MTATADKARYFLEQSVPELKELERKQIFTPQEITSITKKRSDFEYKINSRNSEPSDYTRYAEFEINVESLRRKRVIRMGVRSTAYSGQRRIFFVFDRGTRKFPGDVNMWLQSIDYARRQKANKKLAQIFTNALRLHPAKSELWIYAAAHAAGENGDMTEARSYMQRGLRFCKSSKSMWLEYVRLEMAYIAKIHARRQVLGIDGIQGKQNSLAEKGASEDFLPLSSNAAVSMLPDQDADQMIERDALRNLDQVPALSGAIPIAIIDSAMSQFKRDPGLAYQFFDLVAEFGNLPASRKVLDHILELMRAEMPQDWRYFACKTARATVGLANNDPDYPSALRHSLQHISDGLRESLQRREMEGWCTQWLTGQIGNDLDPSLEIVLRSRLASLS